jgi:hypothetical protein
MLEPRFKGGLANASLTPQKCLLRRTLLLGLSSIAIIGCATSSTSRVTPERRAQIRAAADACLPEHPTVARYDIDHFGQVIAWYKENQGSTAATAPFFECVRARLASAPPAVASPPVSPAAAKAPRLALATPATVAAEQWPTMLPLPANVTIRPPAATVVVSLFSEGFGYTWRRDARIHPDVLMLSVEFLQGPTSVRYRLRSGGTLSMHFDNGGGDVTTMMSHRVP